jgi:hypothetical protein
MTDYRRLEELLAGGAWALADDETKAILCKLAGLALPAPQAYLLPEHIEGLPCDDLQALERLWSTHSSGLYSFSAQSGRWKSAGGRAIVYRYKEMTTDEKIALGAVERAFAREVGWTDHGRRGKIPRRSGHLPWAYSNCSYGYGVSGLLLAAMAWRLEKCGV